MTVTYRHWEAPIAEAAQTLLALCHAVFGEFGPFSDTYLLDRLPHMADPDLWLAEQDGRAVGFKLGYRRGRDTLYSWLGGVLPEMRGRGIASALMVRQHDHARAAGYAHVETRTRAPNNAMIIANLKHGFHIVGYEVDARGIAMITQRRTL